MAKIITAFLKDYKQLTKSGIVLFVLLTASAAYTLSLEPYSAFPLEVFLIFLLGLYLLVSGSFILNQAQERRLDKKMNRTKNRPIPRGAVSALQAYSLAFLFLLFGAGILFLLKPLTAGLALLTVLLYNGFYTLFWKKYLKYGAVWGALPGAMPPVIGWSLGDKSLTSIECVYLFLLLFFWQMPHFWSLAIHYKEDYKKAGFPMLPVLAGSQTTLRLIGFYMLAYVGLALISPLFLKTGLIYAGLLLPLTAVLIYQFYKYLNNPKSWLKFFLWVNASIIVYFSAAVLDQWIFLYFMKLKILQAGF